MIKILKIFLKKQKIKTFTLMERMKNLIFRFLISKQNYNLSNFDIKINIPSKRKIIKNIKLPMIGLHNIRNATAAVALAFTIRSPKNILNLDYTILKEFREDFHIYLIIIKLVFMMIMLIIRLR